MKIAIKTVLRFTLATCAILGTAGLSCAQNRVVVYADEAQPSADEAMIYEARCPSKAFSLRINHNAGQLGMKIVAEDSVPKNVDLSKTQFGSTFLEKSLYGKFYSTCPKVGGIRVYFYGLEPQAGAALKPVKYRVTFNNDGAITDDGGMADESPGGLNFMLLQKREQ